ncbi:MAG: response regulator [Planctomycetes bacterium]|nr:response regulator [Planctomycetota bacterium]
MPGLEASLSCNYALCAALVGIAFAIWAWSLRRVTRRSRDVLVVAAVVTSVTIAGMVWSSRSERAEIQRCFATLTSFAETYAQDLQAQGHAHLADDVRGDDPTYLALIEVQKRWLATNPMVADIYTFRMRPSGAVVLVVDSETDYDRDGKLLGDREQRMNPGEPYESVDSALASAFEGETAITPDSITDRWGTWYSVFAPMRADDGSVEGVLGVDTSAAELDATIARGRRTRLGATLAVVCGLLSAFGAIGLLRARLEERESYEAKLDTARSLAESASRAKSAFLTNMSHELRTPMNGIVGMATLLLDAPLLGEHRNYVETIRGSGEQLLTLLQDMIDLASIEGGNFDPAVGPFDPVASVKTVLAVFHSECIDRGLDLRIDVGEGVPAVVLGDAMRVRQMLRHLVSNAIKFTSQGHVAALVDVVATTTESTVMRFVVEDSGRGISGRQLDDLTDRFTQADDSLVRDRGGVGVGLALTRRLCDVLKGSMRVASSIGTGTTVTLVLPFGRAPADSSPRTQQIRQRTARTRVLVVDDNPVNRKIAAKMLERIGCIADEARGGAEAVQRASQSDYDLVLMDCQMPEMDGFEATRRLRATERGKDLCIVALTAHSMDEHRRMSRECGMNDHITKPVRLEDLVRMIELVAHSRPQPQVV